MLLASAVLENGLPVSPPLKKVDQEGGRPLKQCGLAPGLQPLGAAPPQVTPRRTESDFASSPSLVPGEFGPVDLPRYATAIVSFCFLYLCFYQIIISVTTAVLSQLCFYYHFKNA